MSNENCTPLLPFDATVAENFVIYYPVAYKRDITLIPPEKIAMESPEAKEITNGKQVLKVIAVPDKLINIVVR